MLNILKYYMDIFSLPGVAYRAFANISFANQIKNVILDPLTTIVRLSLLAYMPKGTKIGIDRHQIIYYTPDSLQGIYRFCYGDKRTDLHNLYQPIKKATHWYDYENEGQLQYIFDTAHTGLVRLKDNYGMKDNNDNSTSYDSGASTYMSLTIFDNILTGKQNELYDSITPEKAEALRKELMTTSDNVIHTQLKNLWTSDDINIVFSLLKKIEDSDDQTSKNSYIKVTQEFLESKDKLVYGIVKKHTDSL